MAGFARHALDFRNLAASAAVLVVLYVLYVLPRRVSGDSGDAGARGKRATNEAAVHERRQPQSQASKPLNFHTIIEALFKKRRSARDGHGREARRAER